MLVGGELNGVEQMGQEKFTGEFKNTKFHFEALKGEEVWEI